jgi:aspartyl-tRNA(Asn)/glutamyl-tRNA(Gln) amidotransferase subunit C
MSLTRKDAEKVSLLGRLRLTDQELETMTSQLGRVLEYIEQLNELNTDGVEPMAHAVEMQNVFAPDALGEHLPRTEAIANAPKKDAECYRVPAVLGE